MLGRRGDRRARPVRICKPNPRFLYGAMGLQAELYPRALRIMRELAGAGVIGTASSYKDLTSAETRRDMAEYLADSAATSRRAPSCSSSCGTRSARSSPAATTSTRCSTRARRSSRAATAARNYGFERGPELGAALPRQLRAGRRRRRGHGVSGAMGKPELEFHAPRARGTSRGLQAEGIVQKILAEDPVTAPTRASSDSRPGRDPLPNGVQVHDFWEEVYIVSGDITDLRLNQRFTAGMYACRPPGMEHGPWPRRTAR